MIERDFERYTAHELTQFLRGRLFVYNDFLLTGGHRDLSEEHLDMIDEYFRATMRLIIAWFKKLPSLFPTALADLRKESDMSLIDEDCALVAAYPELMQTLRRYFCGVGRDLRLYAFHDRNVIVYPTMITPASLNEEDFVEARQEPDTDFASDLYRERVAERDPDLVFGSALNHLNFFYNEGGFDAMNHVLRIGNLRPADLGDKKQEYELMPYEMVREIQEVFSNAKALLDPKFLAGFVQNVYSIIAERIDTMTDEDVKEIERKELPQVLTRLSRFLLLSMDHASMAKIIEELQTKVAVRFLRSSYLEKRLQGCTDLRNLLERVDVRSMLDRQRERLIERGQDPSRAPSSFVGAGGGKVFPTVHYSAVTMRDFLLQERVAETLLGENSHPELYKRAATFLKFLSRRGGMTQEIIDRVWDCQDGKHEETVRVIYNLIVDFVVDLPAPLKRSLFDKIRQVPASQYNEMYLTFLNQCTLKALEADEKLENLARRAREKQAQPDQNAPEEPSDRERRCLENVEEALKSPEQFALRPDEQLYGLPIFWSLVQDHAQPVQADASTNTFGLALSSLTEILSEGAAAKARAYFLLVAVNNLRRGTALFASVQVLVQVVKAINESADDADDDEPVLGAQQIIVLLERKVGLTQVVMKGIESYYDEVKKALKELVRKNKAPSENFGEQTFAGRQPHQATIQKVLELLEYIVIGSRHQVLLRAENIEKLWMQFVQQPTFIDDQATFLSFVNKRRYIRVPLTRTETEQIRAEYIRNQLEVPSTRRQEVSLFSAAEQKHLFTQILCNKTYRDYRKIPTGEARCFHALFKAINRDEGSLEQYRNGFEVTDFAKLLGMDSLWEIAFEAETEKIRTESSEILVNLHLKLAHSFKADHRRAIM